MSASTQRNRLIVWVPLLILGFTAQAFLSDRLDHWVHPEIFAAKGLKFDKSVTSTLRAVGFLAGLKVLVGHLFWIKVIQYYGDTGNAASRYAKMYEYCSLASDLNPQFVPIYTLGGAVLAFHVKRLDEAVRLLQKGILSNPKENRLKLMLAAIPYQNMEQYEGVIHFLELQIQQGDVPTMLVNILANTYEKAGRLHDSIALWQKLLKSADTDVQRIEAAQKLQGLYTKLKFPKTVEPLRRRPE